MRRGGPGITPGAATKSLAVTKTTKLLLIGSVPVAGALCSACLVGGCVFWAAGEFREGYERGVQQDAAQVAANVQAARALGPTTEADLQEFFLVVVPDKATEKAYGVVGNDLWREVGRRALTRTTPRIRREWAVYFDTHPELIRAAERGDRTFVDTCRRTWLESFLKGTPVGEDVEAASREMLDERSSPTVR
jgi:hypothetical protein